MGGGDCLPANRSTPTTPGLIRATKPTQKGVNLGMTQLSFDGHPDPTQEPILCAVTSRAAAEFITPLEWLGDVAPIKYAFGAWFGYHLGGCVAFSHPPSPEAAKGVAGDEFTQVTLWLSRGAEAHWAPKMTASRLIGYALRQLAAMGWRIVLAYADPRAGEIGTVYQASNFLYTGLTAKRGDVAVVGETHAFDYTSRSLPKRWKNLASVAALTGKPTHRLPRPRKHRYVYIMGPRSERRAIRAALRYDVRDYPKRRTQDGHTSEGIQIPSQRIEGDGWEVLI